VTCASRSARDHLREDVVDACLELRVEELPGTGLEFGLVVAVEPDDVREELELLLGEVAVRSIDLAKELASVDEQDLIGAPRLTFASIQEPRRDGQEEVRADRDHDVHQLVLDQPATDLALAVARIGSMISTIRRTTDDGVKNSPPF
jgi:hypothetical protein